MNKEYILSSALRIGLGWLFFWAFIDKLFGLGFATTPEKSWLAGASPTFGFLKFAAKGPFAEFYHSLAGSPLVDWLFMLGLAFVGISFLLGIMVRLGGIAGALMMVLMWTALLFPENNPFLDEHLIYLAVFLLFAVRGSAQEFGLGGWWTQQPIVRRYPMLQ